jgi:hypothetical protein
MRLAMRSTRPLFLTVTLSLVFSFSASAQVADPIPFPVEKKGLEVQIKDVVRLPRSRGLLHADEDTDPAGYARVSYVREAPDGRLFANDQRGFFYILHGSDAPTLYTNLAEAFPRTIYNRLQVGFIAFAFHPEFAENGIFYTIHGEHAFANKTPDFVPPGFTAADATHHNIITEWTANDPSADTFEGTRRELLRVAHVVSNMSHPIGFVGFNPTAHPGDPDYGMLYISGSDLGFSNGGGPRSQNPSQTQRLDSVVTAILRVDPRSPEETGGVKGLGDYTIPADNPFANDNDPNTLGEIYAYGFRNAHRLSWDPTDGTMFADDIGMSNIEEVNIVHAGGNYGWMTREGYWDNGINRTGGALGQLFEIPENIANGQSQDDFLYPVAMYDHDEGIAIAGGFAYHGQIEALRGKYVFGDLQRGRLFAADLAAMKAADDGIPRTVAPVEEIQLYTINDEGTRIFVNFRELIEATNQAFAERADMHLSQNAAGELFVTSRQDGMIRMLVPDGE